MKYPLWVGPENDRGVGKIEKNLTESQKMLDAQTRKKTKKREDRLREQRKDAGSRDEGKGQQGLGGLEDSNGSCKNAGTFRRKNCNDSERPNPGGSHFEGGGTGNEIPAKRGKKPQRPRTVENRSEKIFGGRKREAGPRRKKKSLYYSTGGDKKKDPESGVD